MRRTLIPNIPLEGTIARAFDVVDAALHEVAERMRGQHLTTREPVRRRQLTGGSVQYDFSHREYALDKTKERVHNMGSIILRSIGEQRTYYAAEPSRSNKIEDKDTLDEFLQIRLMALLHVIEGDKRRIEQTPPLDLSNFPGWTLADEQHALAQIEDAPRAKRKSGQHTSWNEDIWAWEQVNKEGRSREAVYEEWINKRMSPDRGKLSKPRDTFRKVIQPDWKGRRNAER